MSPNLCAAVYVDNFLNFPVGIPVPFGIYEQKTGQWLPQKNGRIVQLLSIENNKAVLDVTGNQNPATAQELTKLGINDEELVKLAAIYPAGKSLWRVTSNRFSPIDLNWYVQDEGFYAMPATPSPDTSSSPPPDKMTCPVPGSIIDVEKQVLREQIPIVGSEMFLTYSSEYALGNTNKRKIVIPVTRANIPSVIAKIIVEIQIAGRKIIREFQPQPNQSFIYEWDGKDVFGRNILGSTNAKISLRYLYSTNYFLRTDSDDNIFGNPAGPTLPSNVPSRTPGERTFTYNVSIKQSKSHMSQGVGYWTISAHKNYDPESKTLFHGDGTNERAQDLGYVVSPYAGTGTLNRYAGDNGPALNAQFYFIRGLAQFSDGSILVNDRNFINGISQTTFRKILPNQGQVIHFAGNITSLGDLEGENIDKYQAQIRASTIKVAPNDDVYYIERGLTPDTQRSRIRKINKEGRISTIAGKPFTSGYSGDGGPAEQALFRGIQDIAIDEDGSIVIADTENHRIRKIDVNGIITTIAGNGQSGFSGDEGPAINAVLNTPTSVSIGSKGFVYFVDQGNFRVRVIKPDGFIETVAGNGPLFPQTPYKDDVLATSVSIQPLCVIAKKDNSFFICDFFNLNIQKLLKVNPFGTISTLLGGGNSFQEGILARQTKIENPQSLSNIFVTADNEVYFPQFPRDLIDDGSRMHKIMKVSPLFPSQKISQFTIPSKDGKEIYIFDPRGRHLETRSARIGEIIYKFDYTSEGQLAKITDFDGMITQISRDANGNALSIISPHGQITQLSLDANGYLKSVINPNSETHSMTYTDSGLMSSFAKPKGNKSIFSYDSSGNLIKDQNAGGGFLQLVRNSGDQDQLITMSTAESRVSTNRSIRSTELNYRIIKTNPAGLVSQHTLNSQGLFSTFNPDGSVITIQSFADPRLGTSSPYNSSVTIRMPSGSSSVLQTSKSLTRSKANNIFNFAELVNISRNGKITKIEYDSLTRLEKTTSPDGRVAQKLQDLRGRTIASQVGTLTQTNFIFNNKNQLVQTTQGARSSALIYDDKGFLSSITNPLSQKTEFSYDNAGRVNSQKFPDGRMIILNYDANGNMTSITPPGKPTHDFNFNLFDLVNSYQAPDVGIARTTTYSYNLDKQLTRITRPDGQAVLLNYDPVSARLMSMATSSGNYNYSYEPTTGVLSSLSSPDGVVSTMVYDGSLMKSVSMSGVSTGSVQFSYDSNFSINSVSVNNTSSIFFNYTNDNLLRAAGNLSLNYDPVNPLLTSTSLGVTTDALGYNSFGELTNYSAKISNSEVYSINLTRDALGRISSKTEVIQGLTSNYSYSYDTAGRLTSVNKDGDVNNYSYDSNSNRIGGVVRGIPVVATYDNQDRLLTYGTKSFSYNANGDLTSITNSANSVTENFSYDVMGNLKSYSKPDVLVEYLVDGSNRRVAKKVNGVVVQRFVYQNQLQIAAELGDSGNIVARFIYASKSNVPDFMIKSGVTYRIFSDNLGSPRLVVSTSGVVVQRIDYDEFGVVLNDTNPGFTPFGFAGGLYDNSSGLVRFGARDYDPETRRFLTKDPLRPGFGGDINAYRYALNDPINKIDPNGLWAIVIGGGFSGVFGGGTEGSGGFVIGTNESGQIEAGAFLTGGGGFGANVGIDVFAGYYPGNISSVGGQSVNYNLGYGFFTGSLFTDPATGSAIGGTAGLGFSFPNLSGSISTTNTSLFTRPVPVCQ